MIDQIKSLKDKAAASGLSEATLFVLNTIAALKEELSKLIYARTSYLVIVSGQHTTVGGSTSEDIAVTKACAGKQVHVTMAKQGAVPVTIKAASCSNGKITVKFSADPGADHILHYTLIK